MLRSFALSVNVLLVFVMHDLNEALFLKVNFLFLLGGRGGHEPPPSSSSTFLRSKKKKGKQRGRLSKQKLKGQNVTVLAILERLEFQIFYGRPTMVAGNTCQCSMVPPL